jgi:hypothetical protein
MNAPVVMHGVPSADYDPETAAFPRSDRTPFRREQAYLKERLEVAGADTLWLGQECSSSESACYTMDPFNSLKNGPDQMLLSGRM